MNKKDLAILIVKQYSTLETFAVLKYFLSYVQKYKKAEKAGDAPTQQEMKDAALQFVRKVSGFRMPAKKNEAAFQKAVDDVTEATRKLFDDLKN